MTLVIIQGLLQALLAYIAFHVTVHPLDKETDRVKIIFFKIVIATCLLVAILVSGLQFHATEKAESKHSETLSNLTNQLVQANEDYRSFRKETQQRFQELTREFSTNSEISYAVKLAVLNDQQARNLAEATGLQKEHELLNAEPMNIKTLRAERENELEQRDNKNRQDVIQKQIDDINNLKKSEEDAEAERQNQQKTEQKILQGKKELGSTILPVFDYVVAELIKTLGRFSMDSGEKIVSDFPGNSPSVYSSSLVSDGMIANGTNFIKIGTNSAWNFSIYATVESSELIDQIWLNNRRQIRIFKHIATLNIASQTTNGESVLTVSPSAFVFRPLQMRGTNGIGISVVTNVAFNQISIKLNVPNGLNMDETLPSTDYKSKIDEAVRRLIGAQDQQSPLPLKEN